MEAFVAWDAEFETGIDAVDGQHRKLFDLINQLSAAMAEEGDLPGEALRRAQKELVDYAHRHFDDEEQLMASAGVDARHQEHHRREHQAFRDHVLAGAADWAPGELLAYLVNWLTYHILGIDQSLARQIHAIGTGTSPELAYEYDEQCQNASSRLLLRSVSQLFEQLSERNRELTALTRTLEHRVAERTQDLAAVNEELRELVLKLEHTAMTDALTGLPNRRYAMTRLSAAWTSAARHGRSLACLLVDADGFKQVNDTCGHEAGDVVLVRLSEALRRAVRESDEVCRLGGDEFLVICPETPLDGALVVGERLRQAVAALRVEVPGGAWKGSISVGAAAAQSGMSTFEELLKSADLGVYEAKHRGRNCVAVAPQVRALAG